MTIDESLVEMATIFERNARLDLREDMVERMQLKDTCALAAQLLITRQHCLCFGTSFPDAAEYVVQTDNLAMKIERMQFPSNMRLTMLWAQFEGIEYFASALLDMMVQCT